MGTPGELFLQLFFLQVAYMEKSNTLASLLVKSESVSHSFVSDSVNFLG